MTLFTDRWESGKIVVSEWEKSWNGKLQLMDIFYIWLMEIQVILHDSCMWRKKEMKLVNQTSNDTYFMLLWIVNHKIHIKNNYKQLIIQTTD